VVPHRHNDLIAADYVLSPIAHRQLGERHRPLGDFRFQGTRTAHHNGLHITGAQTRSVGVVGAPDQIQHMFDRCERCLDSTRSIRAPTTAEAACSP
jgi:hypothetical protein